MLATECCSCMSQRGVDQDKCKDPQDGGCGGVPGPVFYNNNIGACTAEQVQMSDGPDYMAGTFVWSGFDYLGESRGWPQNVKCRGTIADVAGFTKESAYWLKSWWLSNISKSDAGRPIVHHESDWTLFIVDTWDAPLKKYARYPRNITVYTNAVEVRMELNSKLVGAVRVPYFGLANFSIPYEAGTLTAFALDKDGQVVKTFSRTTPGQPLTLRLTIDVPSRATGTGETVVLDGEDVAMIRAEILDRSGSVVNGASNNVTFTVLSGPGKIWGTHNGDPANLKPSRAAWTKAYQGLARAIVRTTVDASSAVAVRKRLAEITPETERTVEFAQDGVAQQDGILVHAVASGVEGSAQVIVPTSTDQQNLPLEVAKAYGAHMRQWRERDDMSVMSTSTASSFN